MPHSPVRRGPQASGFAQLRKHPETIPMVVIPDDNFYHRLDKQTAQAARDHFQTQRFAPPRDWTVAQLMSKFRERIKVPPKYAMFMFVGDHTLPCNSATLGELFEEHKDPTTAILWMTMSVESTFG